ncbi:F-box-like protein [Ceratobasidium sp. AG-Ba]|nr:F-box-like protein [Ceratobasidium sp. AG-Ba]QRW11008.1 F-box-like protein [Ceratobasidium sp. AG-Ba]
MTTLQEGLCSTQEELTEEEGNGVNVQKALIDWKEARASLSDAIQSYTHASAVLGSTCGEALRQHSEDEPIENALLELDSQSSSLASEEVTLRYTRISLLKLRNQSRTLVPINAYPPEVLARILYFAKDYCYRLGREREYNILAEVCVYWREIAINQPDMWAHIDITPGSSLCMPSIFLKRSRNLPIHVHVVDKSATSSTPLFKRILHLLMPHMHRIHSLNLDSQSERLHPNTLQSILNAWCENGPHTTNSLYFHRRRGRDVYYPDVRMADEGDETGRVTKIAANNVLSFVQILHLEGVLFDQRNQVYHRLVDLRLHGPLHPNFEVPVSLLCKVFASSPQLAILKVQNVNITSTEDWVSQGPYQLPCLKVLNLVGLGSRSIKLVLPLITQPNHHTQLSVGFTFWAHGALTETRDFFKRSEVATVYRRDDISHFVLWGLSKPLSYLIVHEVAVIRSQSVMFQKAGEAGIDLGPPSFVKVDRLALLLCSFTMESVMDLVRACNVKYLRLEACTYLGHESRDEEGHMESVSMDELPAFLSNAFPGIECTICDFDSTGEWPCRALFEDDV